MYFVEPVIRLTIPLEPPISRAARWVTLSSWGQRFGDRATRRLKEEGRGRSVDGLLLPQQT